MWDYEKNGDIPNNLSPAGTITFWVLCELSHSYETKMAELLRGRGCPYCSNKKVLIGFNDLATSHPELSERIHSDSHYSAREVTSGSSKLLLWHCEKDTRHIFEAPPYRLTGSEKRDCPICAGKIVINKINDFKSNYSKLSEMWDYQKNSITPEEVTFASSKKRWWVGQECGHSFQRSPKMLVKRSGCPYCSKTNATTLPGHNDVVTNFPDVASEWSARNEIPPHKVHYGSAKKYWWECEQGHEWEAMVCNRTNAGSGCPRCSMSGTSQAEQELSAFVVSLLGSENVVINSYSIITPHELDIYIPLQNIAIEFNGTYWHSELAPGKSSKNKMRHYNKWLKCKNKGIQLITIWEDDWKDKKDLIKSMLSHKLKVSDDRKIAARKTVIFNADANEARQLYEHNHIQSHVDGFHIGLKSKTTNDIIAMSTWKRLNSTGEIRLERFATSCIVPGGFSKLLKHAIELFKEDGFHKIITFADHEVSDGKLYENNGFIVDRELTPDYKYLYRQRRHHKFGFRLKRFRNDPNLTYKEGLTEKDLAGLNGIGRVWDCGKTKYALII